MEHNHFVKKCFVCKTVVDQCRCADPRKLVIWSVCERHQGKTYAPGDPEWVTEDGDTHGKQTLQ